MARIYEIQGNPTRTKWAVLILQLAAVQDTRFTADSKAKYLHPAIESVCQNMNWIGENDVVSLRFSNEELVSAFGYFDTEPQIWQAVEWLSDMVHPLATWLNQRSWGYHYMVYTLPWEIREFSRFHTNKYKRVPWATELTPIDGHFAHISTEDDTKIAFTENESKGERDVQISMRPGRYLQKFYGEQLTAEEIRDYAVQVDNMHKILFARTADDIENVYLKGPESCMSHDLAEYSSPTHPVRVYGDSDISIAYLVENQGGNERISARCVCWEAKKLFGRIYGDKERLEHRLTGLGFEKGEMDGARIRRIEIDSRCVIMPYIDGDQTFGESDDKQWLVVGGLNSADRTDGLGYVVPVCRCNQCDTNRPVDDMVSVYDGNWCNDCCERYGDVCERTGEIVPEGDLITVYDDLGHEYWSNRAVNRYASMIDFHYFDQRSEVTLRLEGHRATPEDIVRFPWAANRLAQAEEQAA